MKLFYPANIRFPMERANGVQIAAMASAFARAGSHVRLAVRRMDGRSDGECLAFYGLAPEPRLALARYRVLNTHGSDRLWDLSYHAVMAADLLSLCAAGAVDAVYCRSVGIAGFALKLRRLFPRIKVAVEVHTLSGAAMAFNKEAFSDGQDWNAKAARLDRREREVLPACDLLLPLTKGLAEDLEAAGVPPARVRLSPDGVDPARWRGAFRADGPLVYAGHLYPWKGAGVLVGMMRRLPGETLVVAGGTPHEGDLGRLKAEADSAGVAERIRFLGFVEPGRVPEVVSEAAIGLLPLPDNPFARRFTSPMKLFEYMAGGLAIVASDLPSLREVLRDGENALLVPPGDADALAAAVLRLRADPALARRLAEQALRDVQAYTWERRAEGILGALA